MANTENKLQPTDTCINELDALRHVVDWLHMSVRGNKWVGKLW